MRSRYINLFLIPFGSLIGTASTFMLLLMSSSMNEWNDSFTLRIIVVLHLAFGLIVGSALGMVKFLQPGYRFLFRRILVVCLPPGIGLLVTTTPGDLAHIAASVLVAFGMTSFEIYLLKSIISGRLLLFRSTKLYRFADSGQALEPDPSLDNLAPAVEASSPNIAGRTCADSRQCGRAARVITAHSA